MSIHELEVTSRSVTGAVLGTPFRRPEKRWTPIRNPGPGGEAYNLLFPCLRFQRRGPDGEPVAGASVKYSPQVDDRSPIGVAMPPPLPHSDGPNRLWNTVVSLPLIDDRIAQADRDRDEAVQLLRQLVDCHPNEYRQALVEATRWLAELDRDDGYDW